MITESNILKAAAMHTLTPLAVIVSVVVLAALHSISGNTAVTVILAAAGYSATGITSITSANRKAEAPAVEVKTDPGAIRSIGTAKSDG